MPPRFAGADAMQAFEADVMRGLQALIAELKPSTLTDRRRDELVTSQARGWPGRLADLRILHLIAPDTVVCKRTGILTSVKDDTRFLSIEFADTQVTIPAFMRHELPRLLGNCKFRVDEITGMITSSGKVKFITEFVSAGLLRIVEI